MPLCFDLDGTLGTFGSGYRLLRQALGDLWTVEPSLEELRACRGSTDWELVDELHRTRFNSPLPDEDFARYERACLARFEAAYAPEGEIPIVFEGLVEGLGLLADHGHDVWLVSGNVPSVLDFKAHRLGIPDRIPRLGSRPRTDRTDLLQEALARGPHPHLYVGDRPHDRAAAAACAIPFLAIGPDVPDFSPSLGTGSAARELAEAVERLLAASSA